MAFRSSIYYQYGAKPRSDEVLPEQPERSRRFICEDDEWFYRTREHAVIGPYATRENAEKAATTYGRFCRSIGREQLKTLIIQHLERLRSQSDFERRQPLREGEMEVPSGRGIRVLSKGDSWYFQTREGELVGPFVNESEAEESANTFTQFAKNVNNQTLRHLIATMNGDLPES